MLFSVWPLVIRRCLSNWRLLSTILVGVIVTVAILSSLPLYIDAIDEFGLKHIVRDEARELLDLNVYAPNYYVDRDEFEKSTGMITDDIPPRLEQLIHQIETWIKTDTVNAYYTDRDTPGGQFQPKGFFTVYSNLEDHIVIVDGVAAQPAPAGLTSDDMKSADFIIEGMIGSETAAIMDLEVGDILAFRKFELNDIVEIRILITALIDPVDLREEFWALNSQAFTYPLTDAEGNSVPPTALVFIPEDTLFSVVPEIFPSGRASFNWYYYVDPERITTQNAQYIKSALKQFESGVALDLTRSGVLTNLGSIMSEYLGKRSYSQIPLYLIVFQITAVIFYYLIMVSTMIIDRQADEIALLRSRGATAAKILLVYFYEGVIVSVIGAVVGVYLGTLLFSFLSKTGFITLAGEGETVAVNLTGNVLMLTGAALLLCIIALLLPALQASRRGMVHQKQSASRPSGNPFWRRFYLDIAFLIAGGVLYWEAKEKGYFGSINLSGEPMDPLLLVTPLLLIIAFSILFLRVFPLLMKLVSKLITGMGSVSTALGLWYMERKPSHYMRPILLLVVASSVGIFSASFIGTLERSYVERNQYLSGADIRLENLNDVHVSKGNLDQRYMEIEGIENVGVTFRSAALYKTAYSNSSITLLGVDPEKMKEISWFREDFDDKSLDRLMDILAEDTIQKDGYPIPDDAEELGLWVYSEKDTPATTVYVRIKDGKGRFQKVQLGMTDPAYGGWQYMETSISLESSPDFLPAPRNFSSINIRTNPSEKSDTTYQYLCFDDLQVTGTAYSSPLILEDFENTDEWRLSNNLEAESGTDLKNLLGSISTNDDIVHNGGYSGEFSWKAMMTTTLGIFPNADTSPLTAIVSQSFLQNTRLDEGANIELNVAGSAVSVLVREATEYFPTLDPAKGGFIIVNLDRFFDLQNRQLEVTTTYPNEVWLSVADDPKVHDAVVSKIGHGYLGAKKMYDRIALTEEMKSDPLMGAAWKGILLICLLGVTFVSGLGFLIYSYLSAQSRKLDFVILRTIGFSLRQISGLVCFEQFLVIFAGVGFGVLLGSRLSGIMIPFLQLTGQGTKVLPPFMPAMDWGMIGISYGFLFAAFAVTVLVIILYFSRVAIYQTLRMGDM